MRHLLVMLTVVAATIAPVPGTIAADPSILVQSTTSTANSGFYDHVLPIFRQETGITVHVVAVGTGQAIRNARNCDGDVLIVHARPAEERFVAGGYGVRRFDLMFNDFIIVGPASDPAGIAGSGRAAEALRAIAAARAPFASRGDESGTHRAEMALWRAAGIDPTAASGLWYRETGSGMGATLNVGVGTGAYVLTDRGTWLSFENRGDFRILVEGDPMLVNQYGVILISPERCPSVKADLGQRFVDWLLSPSGQRAIGDYRIDGEPLFFPNAGPQATAPARG